MRKVIFIILVLTVLAFGNLFAFGIGGSFTLDVLESGTRGAALSVKLDQLEPIIGVSFSSGTSGNNSYSLGVTADWWMYREPLIGIVYMYAGPGTYVNVANANDETLVDLGLRIPVGIQVFPLDPLELFLEFAPSVGVQFSNPITFPNWSVQGAFGFRFWF